MQAPILTLLQITIIARFLLKRYLMLLHPLNILFVYMDSLEMAGYTFDHRNCFILITFCLLIAQVLHSPQEPLRESWPCQNPSNPFIQAFSSVLKNISCATPFQHSTYLACRPPLVKQYLDISIHTVRGPK
ncbi:hypothetical protein SK128_022398 [Halocaridina rubra]|uniref:Uncharacterized protein n=1 Tax=Halocaridina rubra TaxID=373956 RepID=A0AAN8WET5_HALRR